MITIELDVEFQNIVDEILSSPSGEVNDQRYKIDQRLEHVAQLAIWDAENPHIQRGTE